MLVDLHVFSEIVFEGMGYVVTYAIPCRPFQLLHPKTPCRLRGTSRADTLLASWTTEQYLYYDQLWNGGCDCPTQTGDC
jgi:hypothetical protein